MYLQILSKCGCYWRADFKTAATVSVVVLKLFSNWSYDIKLNPYPGENQDRLGAVMYQSSDVFFFFFFVTDVTYSLEGHSEAMPFNYSVCCHDTDKLYYLIIIITICCLFCALQKFISFTQSQLGIKAADFGTLHALILLAGNFHFSAIQIKLSELWYMNIIVPNLSHFSTEKIHRISND